MQINYYLGYTLEETEFMDPSSLSKFRYMCLKDMKLIDLLLAKSVEIALEKGVKQAKNKLIQDATHTHALFQHRTPREELIQRAKEVRKAVYAVDPEMKEKMPKKKENTRLLDEMIDYCKELIKQSKQKANMKIAQQCRTEWIN